jgi:hypothetical protein
MGRTTCLADSVSNAHDDSVGEALGDDGVLFQHLGVEGEHALLFILLSELKMTKKL